MVMMASCKYLDWLEEMSRLSTSRTLPAAARMCRRMSASSGEAASAISSSLRIEPVILSSKKRLAVRLSK